MNKIISKEQFSEKVFKFEVEAPLIAQSRKAGHFVIVRVDAVRHIPTAIRSGGRHVGDYLFPPVGQPARPSAYGPHLTLLLR